MAGLNSPVLLEPYFQHLKRCSTTRWRGRVTQVAGNTVESEGPFACVGEQCEITDSQGNTYPGEVIGFRDSKVLSMPLGRPTGLRYGDKVTTWGAYPSLRVGDGLLGRVIDGAGQPLDSLGAYRAQENWPLEGATPLPLERTPIRQPLAVGVRAVDAFITCGRGQRLGVFGGSGTGKSTLIGMMTRNTEADLTVVALVGERGREVPEFVEDSLGAEGLKRSVVVASTSDQSPLLRIRAALAATAIAEYFCARGKHVLLVVDSLTRFAMAQREIGLAAGEPPMAKGYTPSLQGRLARLVERAGQFGRGSISAFYTVLMEGDDHNDPLVDLVRTLLDGHIVLDRRLARQNHFPAVSVLDSLSRLMPSVSQKDHWEMASQLRRLLAAHAESEDLIRVGAYQKGSDAVLDKALEVLPDLNRFLQQDRFEKAPLEQTLTALQSLQAEV